jgi:predicted alpha/beta-hydrolase family hydrolase
MQDRHVATARPFFLFAPGAGAPSSHPWMQSWKQRLKQIGEVETFDYDYMREGRRYPDRLPKLIATHRAALASVRAKTDAPIFLIGKSMGGRIGCHVALEEEVAGVICLAYPLCGGGDIVKLRDEVLRELRTRILFVQGTRDSLCPLELLDQVRAQMTAENSLHVVEGGDHSLRVPVRGGESQVTVDQKILDAITQFAGERI